MIKDLLVSLFPASQAGSVVVPETQEVVIRHQPFDGVPDNIYIDGLPLHPEPEGKDSRVGLRTIQGQFYSAREATRGRQSPKSVAA